MKSKAFRAKRWVSLGLLLIMVLSFAAPAFALPSAWYKNIYVTKNPNKMTYEIGESFDPTGMKMRGDVYDGNGNYKDTFDLSLTTLSVSPASFSKAGKQKVTLGLHIPGKSGSFEWLYTSLTVTVNESGDPPSEWYTDIFVAAQPKKTVYTVGESFKTKGLSISGHVYNSIDGKKHTQTKLSQKDMKISPSKFTKAGKQNVKLSLYLLAKGGEYKWFSTTVQVLVEKGEIKITKHPTGETVNENGSCGFVARADNADSRHWFFTKDGMVVDSSDAAAYFPGLSISGTTKEHLKLSNIPVSMSGWSAYCVFYSDDGSVSSKKAGIIVLGKDPTAAPTKAAPAVTTPKPIVTTPKPTTKPAATTAPATKKPTATPKPTAKAATAKPSAKAATPEPDYAEGIYCTINGKSRVPIQGDTLLECKAKTISGYVFDHWEINGEPDYESGATASFITSEAAVIRAYYRERKVLKTVNCYFQLLTKKHNASGTKYTDFDFEDAYYNPVTKEYHEGGTIDFYVTSVIPRKAEIDYWLINGVKYQFPGNSITKFRVRELNEATTIEVVFKGTTPSYGKSHPAKYEELVYQAPHIMRCINCWGQFMNSSGAPSGETYLEFNFEEAYTNPVTKKKLPGGKLDNYISTKIPRGCTVDTWYINDVMYQFPQTVTKIRVRGLDEATTYEVRFRGYTPSNPPPTVPPGTVTRDPAGGWTFN